MTKRIFSLVLALAMCLSVFSISFNSLATDTSSDDVDPIEPTRYTVISATASSIGISGITATCSASLSASYSTSLKIKTELQKKKSGEYETIKTWTDSRTGTALGAEHSRAINVLSTYRMKVTFTAGSESVTYYRYP